MKIYDVSDPEFKEYGQIVSGIEEAVSEILNGLSKTPVTDGVVYVAEDENIQSLKAMEVIRDHCFGGMPVQLGWCNGHNTKLNCLEYHRNSEFNLGTGDFILLLAKQGEIDDDGFLDTEKVKAFKVPAGVLVEVYATTLHYAPCQTDDKGFQVLVALPEGTNTEKPDIENKTEEDKLLTARNKWLLAHPDSEEAKGGAKTGLKGANIDIAKEIEK